MGEGVRMRRSQDLIRHDLDFISSSGEVQHQLNEVLASFRKAGRETIEPRAAYDHVVGAGGGEQVLACKLARGIDVKGRR